MEEKIINKLRKNKKRLSRINKYVMQYADFETIDSETLFVLATIAKIDEELTDIIYLIIDNKNVKNNINVC